MTKVSIIKAVRADDNLGFCTACGADAYNPCSEKVHDDFGVGFHPCTLKGKVERNGKWFCGVHDPVTVAKKEAKKEKIRRSKLLRIEQETRDKVDGREFIYLITVLTSVGDIKKRTWGWYPEFEDAEKVILENQTDIFESYYDLAVIEKVPCGVIAIAEDTWWYKVVYDRVYDRLNTFLIEKIEKIEKPQRFENNFNFGMC